MSTPTSARPLTAIFVQDPITPDAFAVWNGEHTYEPAVMLSMKVATEAEKANSIIVVVRDLTSEEAEWATEDAAELGYTIKTANQRMVDVWVNGEFDSNVQCNQDQSMSRAHDMLAAALAIV